MQPHLSLAGFFSLLTSLALLVLLFSGCAYLAEKPLEVLTYKKQDTSHKNLVVFVRGLGGSHRTFAEEGMVDDTWREGFAVDMVAPDSHFAYYSERTLIPRLHQDVISPARQEGYEKIWLIGPSMGGLGSLLYTREHPEEISGICLLSPFLGDDAIIAEIIEQGGVRHWQPGEYTPEEDWQRMLWHWIKTEVAQGKTAPIYLLYGEEDMYVAAHRLLASVLPADRSASLPGSHDYSTFKALWHEFLDWNLLPRQ
ncbi:MAG: alpha/beta fold hydrolase [Desulfopila sp.]|jgi:pimeloyl-ACP methyl ester carboxylesterase|nr:alpha/beta fold hydrolase [Desulfopila sp.]